MARYNITDPETGKNIQFEGDTPPDEDTIKQAFSQENLGSLSAMDRVGYKGLGAPNDIGQALFPRSSDVIKKRLAGENVSADQQIGATGESLATLIPLLLSGGLSGAAKLGIAGAVHGATTPGADLGQRAVNTGLEGGGGALVGKTLGGLQSLLPFLTKSGVGQKIGAKVEDATAKGVTDTASDVTTEFKQAVANKLGNLQPYSDIANERAASLAPASIESSPTLNPQDLQNIRQQAANRIPQGIFAKFQGKSPSDQVDEILRQVASSRLKDSAGTGNLDKLYSIYSKIGSPAEIAARGIATTAASQLLPKEWQQKAQELAGGGQVLLKILGLL